MFQQFEGLTAVVTGGASGIGAAIVEQLLASGAKVAILDLAVQGANPSASAFATDIADSDSCQGSIARAAEELGGIDVLINNAGIGAQGTIEVNDDDEWMRVFNVNVFGTVRASRYSLPYLRRSAHASIVNVCSIAATAGLPDRALYSASKGAILALTRAMAADHLREGIRVNCVNPGTADTPWVQRLLSSSAQPALERAALNERQPHGRLVTADEVAGAVLYLASPASASTTGTSIAVDGGMQELRLRSSK